MQIIKTGFLNLIANVKAVIHNISSEYYVLALVVFIFIFFLSYRAQQRKAQVVKAQRDIQEKIFSNLDISKGLEHAVAVLLGLVQSHVKAEGYYFYLLDEKKEQFILKAVRHKDEGEGPIAPRYSGLLPYKQSQYIPPLFLQADQQPSNISLVKQGNIPLLAIPIEGQRGIMNIVPVKRISGKSKEKLAGISKVFRPALDILTSLENLKNQVDLQTASSTAIQNFSSTSHDFMSNCNMLVGLTTKMIGATGGRFLVGNEGTDKFGTAGKKDSTFFKIDADEYMAVCRLLGEEDLRGLTRNDKDFYALPADFTVQGIELVIMVKVPLRKNGGAAVFWYNEIPQGELYRFTGLQLMIKRLADLIDNYEKYQELAESYQDMLKTMVETIDNLEPYTVGYSKLMARYSEIIAREMKLQNREIEDIVLAASLSNIGILGFSNELIFKSGQYTENEYETIKMHAEVGASIIEATIANHNVAELIKYHHERIDGYGYPAGLKGEEIPVGARIIAVAQTFLAKISGRRYRDPLPYEKAVNLLKTAAGTQLDPLAVDALVSWFKKKQANPLCKGRSLGACWEMLCVPYSICQECPAFGRKDKNCWEIEGTLCEAHGNNCAICFVYTEYLYRMGPKFDKILE